jgi:outer membrane protein assembly factor BamB
MSKSCAYLVVLISLFVMMPIAAIGNCSAASVPNQVQPEISVVLDVDGIDFGSVFPGCESGTTTVVMTNHGSEAVEATVTVQDDGDEAVFADGVTVNGEDWRAYRGQVEVDGSSSLDLALSIPSDVSSRGEVGGDMTVWFKVAPPSTNEDWPQWQNNVKHYAVTYPSEAVTDPETAWEYDTDGDIDVTPLVVGNTVYTYDGSGTLYAIDKSDGTLIWKNTTDPYSSFQSSIPAYGDGKVFVATLGGYIYAFDAATGERLWSVRPPADYRGFECPITYYDHRIYVGEGLSGGVATKYYYCYDDEGNQIWKYSVNTAGFIWGGATVVGDYLVFPVFEGKLVSVYRSNGTVSDEVGLKDPSEVSFARDDLGMIRSSVTYSNGYIYSTCENGSLLGYLFKTGFENGRFLNEGWSTLIQFSTSTPVVYDGRVYVGNGEHGDPSGNLTCINDADGNVIWSYQVYSGVKSSPTIAVCGGEVYIYFVVSRGYDDKVYCVDGDGELVWVLDPPDGDYILQGCTLSGDSLYFGTDAGVLYCLRNG